MASKHESADELPSGLERTGSDVSSSAGLLSEVSGPAAPPGRAGLDAQARYVEGGELGRGGMGRVRAGFDPVLGRNVALKRAADDGVVTEAQLLAEARITASLDHPGIITVLDVGRSADGALFYAMRVVEGASFREAMTGEGRALNERLRVVLAAAQAMAYAHAHGVVHRDLSASNVRVGRHGEVLVMDWGLAATCEDAARGGVRCGTPGFTAPELAAGGSSGPPADVFSLGALLHLALAGVPPSAPLRRPPGCPAELWAVVVKALAPDPARRYANAGGFEADLRAWLDGRRVVAYQGRPWTPLVRLARRHPSGLMVAVVAASVLAVSTSVLGYRAEQARREAVEATRLLFVASAQEATAADDAATARHALERLEHIAPALPEAVGLRAAFRRAPPWESQPLPLPPACQLFDRRGDFSLCRRGSALLVVGGGRERVLAPAGIDAARVEEARLVSDDRALVFGLFREQHELVLVGVDAPEPIERVQLGGGLQTLRRSADGAFLVAALVMDVVFADPTGLLVRRACSAASPARFAVPGSRRGEAWVLCGNRLVHVGEAGQVPAREGLERTAARGAFRGDALDGERLVIGTVEGQVALLALEGSRLERVVPSVVGPVQDVLTLPGTPFVAVRGRDGLGFLRHDLASWVHVERGKFDEVRWLDGELASRSGERWRRWSVPADRRWHRASFDAGLTSVAWAPDGRSLAVGDAASQVRLVDVETGAVRLFTRDEGGVVTDVTFSADGAHLAWSTAGPRGLDVVELATGARLDGPWRDEGLRARAVAFRRGELLAVDYGARVRRFSLAPPAELPSVLLPSVHVVDVASRGERLVALLGTGELVEVVGERVVRLPPAPGATALALTPSLDALLAFPGYVARRSLDDGRVLERRDAPGATVTGLAATDDGRWVLARVVGDVEVLEPTGVVLRAAAHRARAGGVAWAPAGRRFSSVGWDGVLRLFDVEER